MSLYSAENQKIVLLGYMGSGKSAIGKSLAELSSLPYIDLDDFMVESENMSIDQIFSQKGEIYFRKKEHHYLLELLNIPGQKIIALGGGTPCYHDNISLLKTEGIVSIYLKTSIETLANRLKSETEKRPILKRFSVPSIYLKGNTITVRQILSSKRITKKQWKLPKRLQHCSNKTKRLSCRVLAPYTLHNTNSLHQVIEGHWLSV